MKTMKKHDKFYGWRNAGTAMNASVIEPYSHRILMTSACDKGLLFWNV